MNIPTELKYSNNDEWVRIDGHIAVIGITDYAQSQLSDIVFVEVLVKEGETPGKGESCATVESVKAAADVYMPVGGKVIAANEALSNAPEMLNNDPYGEAWLVKIEISDLSELQELLDAAAYTRRIEEKG